MSFRVQVSDRAYADLVRLTEWLAQRSPETADRITARFFEARPRLETHPLACGLARESRHFPEELRHLLFEVSKGRKYRVLFVVRGDLVEVLAVRGPGEKDISPKGINQ